MFPVDLEEDLQTVLPSLVQLARLMYQFGFVVGAIDRSSARFLDFHCFTRDEAEYDTYWSSAEQMTQSQSSVTSDYLPDWTNPIASSDSE